MTNPLRKCWLCLFLPGVCLLFVGCLELVRRPAATHTDSDNRSSWADPGNPPSGEDVKKDTVATSQQVPIPETAQSPDLKSPKPRAQGAGDRVRISTHSAADRGDDRRRDVQQVNEYAFWCIQNSMWEEARLHLERALEQDSLAASLHNNLGIVYEKQGERDRAEESYERARLFMPAKELYGANLERLQDRKRLSLERPTRDRSDSLGTGLELEETTAADSLALEPIGIIPRGVR